MSLTPLNQHKNNLHRNIFITEITRQSAELVKSVNNKDEKYNIEYMMQYCCVSL